MKFIGFLANHEAALPQMAQEEFFSNNNTAKSYEQVVSYLSSGYCIAAAVSKVHDVFTQTYVDGLSYHTDGEYVWPVYLSYYLKNYPEKVALPEDFVAHLEMANYTVPQIEQRSLYKIENEFAEKWEASVH